MDLDNITDLNFLRGLLKKYMIQVKQSFFSYGTADDEPFKFFEGCWYDYEQDDMGITVYAGLYYREFDYDEARKYLNMG